MQSAMAKAKIVVVLAGLVLASGESLIESSVCNLPKNCRRNSRELLCYMWTQPDSLDSAASACGCSQKPTQWSDIVRAFDCPTILFQKYINGKHFCVDKDDKYYYASFGCVAEEHLEKRITELESELETRKDPDELLTKRITELTKDLDTLKEYVKPEYNKAIEKVKLLGHIVNSSAA